MCHINPEIKEETEKKEIILCADLDHDCVLVPNHQKCYDYWPELGKCPFVFSLEDL